MPVGSGCVAQVYKGKLVVPAAAESKQQQHNHALGRRGTEAEPLSQVIDVAVKVVHPSIRDYINRDLAIVGALVWVVELVPASQWLGLSGMCASIFTLKKNKEKTKTTKNHRFGLLLLLLLFWRGWGREVGCMCVCVRQGVL